MGSVESYAIALAEFRRVVRLDSRAPAIGPVYGSPGRVTILCGVTGSIAPLAQCRTSLGHPPRHFSWFDRFSYLRIPRSGWAWLGDPLGQILEVQDLLLTEGRLVWGAVVQANNELFERGWRDRPAAVIYSPDTAVFDDNPELLLTIARKLYRLKETWQADPELHAFSRMLTSEVDRQMRMQVPRQLTGSADVYCTDIIVARRHLPGRVLNEPLVPLLIAPEHTAMTMMLPSRFWSASA
ncbi:MULTISPECIES: hypothetical protein [unclassified Streptomyces]|uniref:hypothetical protein n=1 Tax=unclassified Streptomyces TaxID=2593676 RepID=UPI000DB9E6C3|nr:MULTISPECIES: hypothetical protein [unclassified Streptomyces]MYT69663.1 hypothetical protein [Streptomyces sp. SID8367]RAJ70729.1 hypothetical protein K377_07805 [Streptomyces sp. PsTaAH-137]